MKTKRQGPVPAVLSELIRDVFEGSWPRRPALRRTSSAGPDDLFAELEDKLLHPELTYFVDHHQGFDHLAEVPRDHVVDVLEEYAKDAMPPPRWAAERFGQLFPKEANGGRPRTNILVNLIRAFAVERCSVHGQRGRYERAARLLHKIPAELFSGLEVAADAETLRKSCRNVLSLDRKSDEACLRHYFPLLIEAIESRA